mmetsp:Transcript_123134/g.195250  ORF Transcript_123134/g.195250 Transcript_123134/m.195250 type:complete len:285 (+) Transcript_123134:93-947(+)
MHENARKTSRSPIRARGPFNASVNAVSSAFGSRVTNSRSPPPPRKGSISPVVARRGTVSQSDANRTAHITSVALAAREARHPSPAPSYSPPSAVPQNSSSINLTTDQLFSADVNVAVALEVNHLRAIANEERRRREQAEQESTDLRRRLRLATEEAKTWREKCKLLESDLKEMRISESRRSSAASQSLDSEKTSSPASVEIIDCNLDTPLYEAELSAIESALDKVYVQRATLTADLEHMRQRLLATLDGNAEALSMRKLDLTAPAASPRGPVPPAMSPRDVANA